MGPLRILTTMALHDVTWLKFKDNIDPRGRLTALEYERHIPFELKRVFFVHQVPFGTDRGGHAHRDTDQVLVCVHGCMKVDVTDGSAVHTFELDDAASGIFVPRLLWTRLYDFQTDAVLAVFASTIYDQSRSIRTWDEYCSEFGLKNVAAPAGGKLISRLE